MKRKFLTLALAALTAFSAFSFASCNEEKKETNSVEEKPVVGKVCLNDFESYKPDFSLIRFTNNFGAVSVNTDKQYVKSGNSSAKLQPLGGYKSTSSPFMYIPFYSTKYEYDYKNLSRIREVTAEIYNAEDTDVNMSFGLVMEAVTTDVVNKTAAVKYELKPGWNTVSYLVDVSIINILYDVTDCQGVYFSFDATGSRFIEDAPVLYLDDVNLIYAAKEATVQNLLSFDGNEICSFDKLFQNYIVYAEVENPAAEPTLSVVKTKPLGFAASNGESALRLTTKPGSGLGTWQRMIFPQAFMDASPLTSVKVEDFANTYFCFDIYAEDRSMTFYPEFFDSGYGVCYNKWACEASVGRWSTVRINLTELKQSMVERPGFFRIAWCEYNVDYGELDFYFDNFRLETSA